MPINKDEVGLAEALTSIAEMVERFMRKLQEVADEALKPGSKFRAFLESLPEVQARIEALPAKTQRALSACGLPALHSFFSLEDVSQFIQIFEQDGVDAARVYIESRARDALNSAEVREHLLNEWARNQQLVSRMEILRDALEAHANRKYSLSVPVFISQLEGLIATARGRGKMNFAEMKAHVDKIVQTEHLMGPHVSAFVNSILLATFEHGANLPFDFSRHAILHGGDVSYGTEWNSIRAIALFDYIQAIIDDERKQ
jgi:hypothetical protein